MRKAGSKRMRAVCLLMAGALVLSQLCTVQASAGAAGNVGTKQADPSYTGWVSVDASSIAATAGQSAMKRQAGSPKFEKDGVLLQPGDGVSVTVSVPEAGSYEIVLEYRTTGSLMQSSTATVAAGSTSVKTSIYGLWQDQSKTYTLDRYGNEVTPEQKQVQADTQDYVRDSTLLDWSPSRFDLKSGTQTLTVVNNDQAIRLKSVKVVRPETTPSYAQYAAGQTGASAVEPIILEGENYAVKSDSFIRSKAEQNAAVTPYSPYRKLLSTVDWNSYKTLGQRIEWDFTVPKDGWYNLGFHYSQPNKEGQPVYRDIEIDGKVPFAEMNQFAFSYTGSGYANAVVEADGQPAKIYLKAGAHTVGLFTQAPSLAPAMKEIKEIVSQISDIGLSLQQVAGNNADVNRTWDIEKYIPGVTARLTKLQQRLTKLYNEMGQKAGTTPASCINLKLAASIIRQALRDPGKLPTYVSQLSVGSGSATDLLAQMEDTLTQQGISLDRIYLYGDGYKMPSASAGFFKTIVSGTERFFYSIFHRDSTYDAATADKSVLNIWVSRPIAYVETMQMLADSRYTPKSGVKVKLSVMPDENKLLLANASNTCPDVALGVSGDRPYQLGLRGAATDFTQFKDFASFVKQNFTASDLEPYVFNGKIYGISETKQFYVLFYRKDILNKLGLSVPQTWDDVAAMMPVLRRSGMTFYMPLSSWTGVKQLSGTVPFFLQAGASLYSKDGTKAAINSEKGIQAFEAMTDLYTLYSVQNNMPSFYNNFRYGVTPVGIGDFSNYVQMLYAAPEIADDWGIALSPGMKDSSGVIHRQQTTVDRSCLIMQSSDKKSQAWNFLKWWLSADTQTEFGYTLETKFGSEFVWNSANKNAFAQLSFPSADRKVILEQWAQSQNYQNVPATYMLERALSDAWYSAVQQHVSPRVALNQAEFTVNQEMQIKLKEFGYEDDSGRQLKAYDMETAAEILSGVRK